jgi:hypothetical protein
LFWLHGYRDMVINIRNNESKEDKDTDIEKDS